ncbi:GlsB/YeaQ/YmgE family stress response membrane protein [Actinomadura madurae]|uniref:GlsB/YeaQ/YmgE family stress response membrane protein n=2 Tax=Actinomadura madurae TaxID=1993 RepID=UPI0020260CAF|nr:GlsB/YeaQ/YmgE family stress response membrane protein [Actinomadura madurae]MCP9953208.1 GlsB/YeaQ/YmgE family stress response membrane protein [Actinomadura madurae]MCP9969967.1 GlsB/YeaQ/YmgE family stress response membrane protein [Actinomadura madurae]MCQ0006048.1 GlsB/YeaQ/YmgE family stress response membrane protein [Actinomadura madurae]MCQ0018668.1 GlsB/YeaQ/YmgE family stress response membrane protein [Actinomadura madurae]URM98676.1 GlsB/YeaQ/YmgE family stress response membrane 
MNITGIITAIVIGAIIGALGRLLLPGRQPIGVIMTVIVGIVAAIAGTAIAQQVGVDTTDGIDWIELVFQVGLAMIGVAIVASFRARRRHRRYER